MALYSARTALLGNLIDYAGTFPPAALPLDKAMQELVAFRKSARFPWLLAKTVVTIADLSKLSPRAWVEAGSDGTPLPLTVIGSPVEKREDLARHVAFELREIRRFNEKYMDGSQRQQVLAYETRLPENLNADAIEATLAEALNGALNENVLGLDVYFEVSLEGEWQTRLARATHALSEWIEEKRATVGLPGIKVRTGGKFFPSAEQLADVVTVCTTHGLRFKATQGLHHAISRPKEYGFVNLFGAFAFAGVLGVETFDPDAIAACLKEADPSAFKFQGKTFAWKKFEIEAEQIEAARRRHAGTFGSCSLAEPDAFLAEEFPE